MSAFLAVKMAGNPGWISDGFTPKIAQKLWIISRKYGFSCVPLIGNALK
jgi:hypothetical protein